MADIHIDDFCRDTALVLLQLYNGFPLKKSVFVEDISGPDEPDEVGLHSRRHMACLGAMVWLAEENYIRFDSLIYQDGVDQAVLTNRAFILLSAASDIHLEEPDPDLPRTLASEKLTLVEQIRAALRSGNSERLSTIMRFFFSRRPETVLSPAAARDYLDQDPSPRGD